MIIYALGVLQVDLSDNARRTIKDQRLWYLFKNFGDAEKCVLENQSDIFEYYYNMALIEEVYVHDYTQKSNDEASYAPQQWWYQITYHQENNNIEIDPTIVKISRPNIFENISRFWVG